MKFLIKGPHKFAPSLPNKSPEVVLFLDFFPQCEQICTMSVSVWKS